MREPQTEPFQDLWVAPDVSQDSVRTKSPGPGQPGWWELKNTSPWGHLEKFRGALIPQ